jgi:hypothetical protein
MPELTPEDIREMTQLVGTVESRIADRAEATYGAEFAEAAELPQARQLRDEADAQARQTASRMEAALSQAVDRAKVITDAGEQQPEARAELVSALQEVERQAFQGVHEDPYATSVTHALELANGPTSEPGEMQGLLTSLQKAQADAREQANPASKSVTTGEAGQKRDGYRAAVAALGAEGPGNDRLYADIRAHVSSLKTLVERAPVTGPDAYGVKAGVKQAGSAEARRADLTKLSAALTSLPDVAAPDRAARRTEIRNAAGTANDHREMAELKRSEATIRSAIDNAATPKGVRENLIAVLQQHPGDRAHLNPAAQAIRDERARTSSSELGAKYGPGAGSRAAATDHPKGTGDGTAQSQQPAAATMTKAEGKRRAK